MSPRVLIAEDDALSLKLMRDALQAGGFETSEIGDGSLAVDAAVAFPPDLIVMDIGLPGLDGIEATRLLRADRRTASIPVVAVTAFAMAEDERRMREAGCDAFLTKPLKLRELLAVIRGLIRPP